MSQAGERKGDAVTEVEWLECTRPERLLTFLEKNASQRRLRLFAVACCRRVWRLLKDGPERQLLLLSEISADGGTDQSRLEELAQQVYQASTQVPYERRQAILATVYAARGDCQGASNEAVVAAAYDITQVKPPYDASTHGPWYAAVEGEKAAQTGYLRDIIGNPFHPVTLNPAWLTWRNGTIPKIALGIYEERRFENMPILADALEEAGCSDWDILNHCRQPGEHVRGCWLVDALIGKE